MNKKTRFTRAVVAVALSSIATGFGLQGLVIADTDTPKANQTAQPEVATPKPTNPLDAQRAYRYLLEICEIGPRPSGSTGMEKQRSLLESYFKNLGGNVSIQRFQAAHPKGGDVSMANILVEWHPERKNRILLVAHYDTRPHADRDIDPVKRREGAFIGANDGASGVAVLMELAHLMPNLVGPIGVDFLFVDGEELVYTEGQDPYFLGSTWFARQYAKNPPDHKYRWGVVLDMVGDSDLSIYQDRFSTSWSETRPLVKSIWATAARLGVKEFIPRIGYVVQDDHVPLRNTAKIPTIDLIDFADAGGNTPPAYWHTMQDTPQRCSGASLAKVGWVVYEWLRSEQLAAIEQSRAKP